MISSATGNMSSAEEGGVRIPLELQVVAVLFLVYGIFSAAGMLHRLVSGDFYLDLGIFCIPAYFGLRRFSQGWRTFALVGIWIGLLTSPIIFLASVFIGKVSRQILGFKIAGIPSFWSSAVVVLFFLLYLWQYRVLTRPDIRALFGLAPYAAPKRPYKLPETTAHLVASADAVAVILISEDVPQPVLYDPELAGGLVQQKVEAEVLRPIIGDLPSKITVSNDYQHWRVQMSSLREGMHLVFLVYAGNHYRLSSPVSLCPISEDMVRILKRYFPLEDAIEEIQRIDQERRL